MKVNVEAQGFDVDSKLISFIEKKLAKLEQYYDKITHGDVFLKLEQKNKPENKVVEVLLSVPGDQLICKKMAKSFEEGLDSCVSSLERVVKRHKDKVRA